MGFFVCLFFISACLGAPQLVDNGSFVFKDPAFIAFQNESLIITSFSGSPFTKGSVWSARWQSNVTQIVAQKQFGGLAWPNNITPSPDGRGYVFGDGFLVPGKSDGGMYLVRDGQLHDLTAQDDHFYHKGHFFDVDGDGDLDVVTAKAKKPLLGSGTGELVWLENPGTPETYPWKSHHLADGPDIDTFLLPINGSAFNVFAAEFFGKKLSQFTVSNGVVVDSRVIDDSIGEVYAVRAVDLYGNGNTSLVVSNYKYDPIGSGGSVFIYSGSGFTQRSTLATGFVNKQLQPGSGAPGWVYPHYPTRARTGPMNVFVCGDGSEDLSLFSLASNGTWTRIFHRGYGSTVGAMALGDFDGDGYTDALVTDYNNGFVHAFTYQNS